MRVPGELLLEFSRSGMSAPERAVAGFSTLGVCICCLLGMYGFLSFLSWLKYAL